MKKLVRLTTVLCMLLIMMHAAYATSFTLPDHLTRIEEEAFLNDQHITGVVDLPETVTSVGPRAFAGAGVFALAVGNAPVDIPPDAFDALCYIRIEGPQAQLPAELIAKAKYLFASPGAQADEQAAREVISPKELVAHDGFYYQIIAGADGESALRLLCAIDGALPKTVIIPHLVQGMPVTKIAKHAFWGCEGISAVQAPQGVDIEDGATDHLPSGALQTYAPVSLNTPEIIRITCNANMVELGWIHDIYADLVAEGYYVWRCDTADGVLQKVATVTNEDGVEYMTWTDKDLPLGSTWYYALQAFADGGRSSSDLSPRREVQVSNTLLPRASVWAAYQADGCVVSWRSPEGADVTRTDVYRSTTYDGDYTFIATTGANVNTYTDTDPAIYDADDLYYRVQQYAVIDGTEWVSEMSLPGSAWAATTEINLTDYYDEGVRLGFNAFSARQVTLYRSDSAVGPWQEISQFSVAPENGDDYVYAYHLIPAAELANGGYFRANLYDESGAFLGRLKAFYLPAWGDFGLKLTADADSCETGAAIRWTAEYLGVEKNDLRLDYQLYLNDEKISILRSDGTNAWKALTQQDGVYKLVATLRTMDGGRGSTVIASSEAVASTLRGCPHPYRYADLGEYWFDGEEDSGYQLVTFSEATYFGSGDQAVIFDEWGNDLYTYTGYNLRGVTLTIPGTGVGVRLEGKYSSSTDRGFGFAIVDMVSMPYIDLQGVGITSDRTSCSTQEAIVWTAEVKDGCVPFTTKWNIFLDGELHDTLSADGLSLTYYPVTAGQYTVVAEVSDYRSKIAVSGGSCTVTAASSSADSFTYQNNGFYIILTGYTGHETTVIIPETIEGLRVLEIANNAFANTSAKAWVLPNSVERIKGGAFSNSAAEEIILPQHQWLTLAQSAFANTKHLRRIILPEGMTSLPDRCFENSGIQHVTLPSSLTSIGDYCFRFTNLNSIHLPANVKTLGVAAFQGCKSLSSLTFDPVGLTTIGNSCFENCELLTHIVLPKTVKTIGSSAFRLGSSAKEPFAIWIGAAATNIADPYSGSMSFSNCTIYAPEGSSAAQYALTCQGNAYVWATITYGGAGCNELFGGEHDYEPISDTLLLDTATGLHMHDVIYKCYRCGVEKTESQAKTALGCWRCEAKAAYGADADIPAAKFEFLGRYKLEGKIYYRVRLLESYKGVKQGAEALFMNEALQMVTDEETLKYLFRVYIYTGEGSLPWEYTGATDDLPTLERRKQDVASAAQVAADNLRLAEQFIKLDECYQLLGEVAHGALQTLWGNPIEAIKTVAGAAVPDMDALLVAAQVYILQQLADSMDQAAHYYQSSLKGITDVQGFIICEKAEASLIAYADTMGLQRLCIDNGAPIIKEVADCGTAFGVGVRNIITMLKGATDDSLIGKLGTFVTDKLFKAITSDDVDNDTNVMDVVALIGDMCDLLTEAVDNKYLSAWVNLYKAGQFSLNEALYMDSAFEAYERHYDVFCLKGTVLQETHRTLAGE